MGPFRNLPMLWLRRKTWQGFEARLAVKAGFRQQVLPFMYTIRPQAVNRHKDT